MKGNSSAECRGVLLRHLKIFMTTGVSVTISINTTTTSSGMPRISLLRAPDVGTVAP